LISAPSASQALAKPGVDARLHLGQSRRDLVDDPADLPGTRRQHFGNALAFARARGGKCGQRFREQGLGCRDQGRRIPLLVAHDAGPAQQVHRVDAPGGAEATLHRERALDQAIEEGLVEQQFAPAGDAGAQVQRGVHLAAARAGCDRAPDLALRGAELLRQAQAELEIAVIDASDLPGEHPGRGRALAAREACHALQHSIDIPGVRCCKLRDSLAGGGGDPPLERAWKSSSPRSA
jgi:hypothetical protein